MLCIPWGYCQMRRLKTDSPDRLSVSNFPVLSDVLENVQRYFPQATALLDSVPPASVLGWLQRILLSHTSRRGFHLRRLQLSLLPFLPLGTHCSILPVSRRVRRY